MTTLHLVLLHTKCRRPPTPGQVIITNNNRTLRTMIRIKIHHDDAFSVVPPASNISDLPRTQNQTTSHDSPSFFRTNCFNRLFARVRRLSVSSTLVDRSSSSLSSVTMPTHQSSAYDVIATTKHMHRQTTHSFCSCTSVPMRPAIPAIFVNVPERECRIVS
jgi:hypothetical protein